MKIRFPLYAKILLWFFLNLVFLGLVFYAVFRMQFRFGLDSLLAGRAGDQIQAVSEIILNGLRERPRADWNEVLKGISEAYQIQFFVFRNDGGQIAGASLDLPPEVRERLIEPRMGPQPELRRGNPWRPGLTPGSPPFGPRLRGGRPFSSSNAEPATFDSPVMDSNPFETFRPGQLYRDPALGPEFLPGTGPDRFPRLDLPSRPRFPKFMLRTKNPIRYWVLVRVPVSRQGPLALLAMSDSIRVFFDYTPWIAIGSAVLLVSVLFWFPLVRGITHSISQMTQATERIAEGRFEVRVPSRRRDELGSLGQAINRMASRIASFLTGQKRFLGDIAHELCAPLARSEVALAILDRHANASQKDYVQDVREEVQQMSQLVNELLSFSKAGLKQREIALAPVRLREIAERVVAREAHDCIPIDVRIEDSLQALGDPELLTRALANVIRNAARYAGNTGPISITAERHGSDVMLRVADQGPGVPPEMLEQIFDPFFRVEASRSRETGGAGLGLAIVKACVEACRGSVAARNREPTGLQIEITLKNPPAEDSRSQNR